MFYKKAKGSTYTLYISCTFGNTVAKDGVLIHARSCEVIDSVVDMTYCN